MAIWFTYPTVEDLNKANAGTIHESLGIRFSAVGDDYLEATMPVDKRTHQPYGLLHGGASVVLAESLGSMAAAMVADHDKYYVVGQEINANHVRAVRSGEVTGTARPIHTGQRSHVWEIRIRDERDKLVCISRITLAILPKPSQ